ncbi:hypothetical protein V5739_12075 [Salinimicrobium sp. TIG7-5_MAKvit]|uniref:sodium:calcium antiporter n=1 Tax=Salinimicrobium sp. TIG7-5_MAKvit TaxID=3121289 RepID=UPI003C6E37B8
MRRFSSLSANFLGANLILNINDTTVFIIDCRTSVIDQRRRLACGELFCLCPQKNVSDLAIGLTIVAFGTSAPELVVNVVAAYQGHDDIVFGNVIGSNNFNLFFILGVAGLISPLLVQQTTVWKEKGEYAQTGSS